MPFVLPNAPAAPPPSDGIIRNGLISRWPFDDGIGSTTVRDDQSTNIGTLDPTMDPQTAWVEGRQGGDVALECRESSDEVTVPDADELDQDNISITGWFKHIFTPALWGGVVGKTNTSWNQGWGIFHSGSSVRFFYGNYNRSATFGLEGTDRAWHLFIATYDGTTKRLYIDDVEGTPNAEAESPQHTSNNITFANLPGGGSIFSILQDFRLYNRELNASERTAIFNGIG